LREAEDYSERAYAKARQAGDQLVIDQSMLERARIYTALHEPGRAAAMLAEVEPGLRRNLPSGHYAFATLASVQALVALQTGDRSAAIRLADEAVRIDEAEIKAGREGSFYLPALLITRSAVALRTGRAEQAAADATRTLSLLSTGMQAAPFSSIRGNAFLALARALRAQGKSEEARAAFRSAAEQLRPTLGPNHADTRSAQQLAESVM